jgi:hypothetical protein
MPGCVVIHKVSPASMEHGSYYSLIYISIIPASFNKKNNLFASRFILNLRKKLLKCSVWCWNMDILYSRSEITGKFWNVVLEKIIWADHVKNVVFWVKEEWNILQAIKQWKAIWIGCILHRNCLLEHVIQEKIEVMGRWGRRCNQLLNDFKEMREYWKKREALECTCCRTCFGRGYGSVVRQIT